MNKVIKNIYVHLPFCKKKCSFCDFSIYAIGKESSQGQTDHIQNLYKTYVDNLLREIRYIGNKYENLFKSSQGQIRNSSIYFGGGTPSLLPPEYIEMILKEIKLITNFDFTHTEISLETDPGTFDENKLNVYHQLGINRITMGVQSLDPLVFSNLNRSHTLDETKSSLDIISKSKFNNNYGIDFIQGLPQQDLKSIENDFEFLSKYRIPHLSIYMLSLEKKSSLYKKYEKIYKTNKRQEEIADMFIWTHNYLKDKYDHYEISNFALLDSGPEKEKIFSKNYSIHNKSYWDGFSNFYGFGSSSSSYFIGNRFKKPKSITKYFKFVENILNDEFYFENYVNNRNDDFELNEDECVNVTDNYDVKELKYLLLNQIRRREGINLTQIEKNFAEFYLDISKFFEEMKMKDEYLGKNINFYSQFGENYVSIQFPEGILLSDEILVRLYVYAFR